MHSPKTKGFNLRSQRRAMSAFVAQPLQASERQLLHEGLDRFDRGAFWHAHESWEDLWNALKARQAPMEEVLLVQGLIQTAALLLHHERHNAVGVSKQWAKLQPKLEGWVTAWGLDIQRHMQAVEAYAKDGGTWSLVAATHRLPRA
jgi:hypothetical protein